MLRFDNQPAAVSELQPRRLGVNNRSQVTLKRASEQVLKGAGSNIMQGGLPPLKDRLGESPHSRRKRERLERQARERQELQQMVDLDPYFGRFSRQNESRRSTKPAAAKLEYQSVPTRESKIIAY